MKATLPPVTLNGPASSATDTANSDVLTSYFDSFGRVSWTKDGAGYIQYRDYDVRTGTMTTYIEDVNTTLVTGEPGEGTAGAWVTPGGAGLHLATTVVPEEMGRPETITLPNLNSVYVIYKDAQHEMRVYRGWNSTTHTATGPIEITRQYRPGAGSGQLVYDEYLTSTATPAADATAGKQAGGENVDTSPASLSRDFKNKGGQLIASDRYFNIAGTYSRSVTADANGMPVEGFGTLNTNYYRTEYGYDYRGRQSRVKNDAGTIRRFVYDGPGNVVSYWIGTNDTGATHQDPTGGGASGNNMMRWRDDGYESAPAAPTLSDNLGGALPATTYYVTLTYVDSSNVERPALSSVGVRSVATGRQLVVSSPAASGGAAKYNVYVSTTPGVGQRQNPSPITIGTSWTMPTTGITTGASAPVVIRGNGTLTQYTLYTGDGVSPNRTTEFTYDWRDRLVGSKAGVQGSETTAVNRPLYYYEYDNLDNLTAETLYDGDGASVSAPSGTPTPPSTGIRRARTTVAYDEQGRPYLTMVLPVDGSGNIVGAGLHTDVWYDRRGYPIKTQYPGGLVSKVINDGAGRPVTEYTSDGGGDLATGTGWSQADDVVGDIVLSQVETTYDKNGNEILVATRERFHTETGTDALGTPTSTTQPKARVSYQAFYYDAADRLTGAVDVGTNATNNVAAAYNRPSTLPPRNATTLVTSYDYNPAGYLDLVTDPRGTKTKRWYDNLGRITRAVEAYDSSINGGDPTALNMGVNRRTDITYTPLDQTATVTAVLPDGLDAGTDFDIERTGYAYTSSRSWGQYVDSNDWLNAIYYPDKTTGDYSFANADSRVFTTNLLGEASGIRDLNQTWEDRKYKDAAGRDTESAIVILGAGVDGAIRRIHTDYDEAGRPHLFTSYVGLGSGVSNQVKREFNNFGQLVAEYQDHNGGVTATSPVVRYTYREANDNGTVVNDSRLMSMTYPNGRVLNYKYGGASGLDDHISRVSSMEETVNSVTTPLEAYDYLGLNTVVQRRHPQSGVDLTYYYGTGAVGEAGDQYGGLDRFGRVIDQWWKGSTDVDRFKYGYDENSNVLFKNNIPSSANSELYHANGASAGYDKLDRLTEFRRGALTDANADGTPDTVSASARSQTWSLDALGNWSSTSIDGGTATTRNHNKRNQVTLVGGVAPDYDNNGNMTVDERGNQFVYDGWNRPVQMKDFNDVVQMNYKYDALNRRIVEDNVTAGTTTHLYYSSDWQVLEERQGSSSAARTQYVWGLGYVDEMVLRDRDVAAGGDLGKASSGLDERLYVQQDANYNITSITNVAGAVQERYLYDPYGAATFKTSAWANRASSSFGWRYLHQGGRYDSTSGLYHFRNRDYSPVLGRPIQPDPIGYADGMNTVQWERSNPINLTDPFGLQPTEPPPFEGTWQWEHDAQNSRGGRFRCVETGKTASWDRKDSHWDVDDGTKRTRYNRWGKPLTPAEAHNPPKRYTEPISRKAALRNAKRRGFALIPKIGKPILRVCGKVLGIVGVVADIAMADDLGDGTLYSNDELRRQYWENQWPDGVTSSSGGDF